jgi:hypothetical protein
MDIIHSLQQVWLHLLEIRVHKDRKVLLEHKAFKDLQVRKVLLARKVLKVQQELQVHKVQ